MMRVPCAKCRGQKKCMQLGGIISTCTMCLGTGFVDTGEAVAASIGIISADVSDATKENRIRKLPKKIKLVEGG